jgi:peptide/nickel transport system substrate-binding protein
MSRKIQVVFSLLLLVSVSALAACGGDTTPGGGSGGGNTVGGGSLSGPIRLDPAVVTDQDSLDASGYVYEGLVKLENGAPASALAEKWLISEDQLSYTFTLRGNAQFSNGDPVNAAAVIANFTRWLDPASPLRGSGKYEGWAAAFGGFLGETTDTGVAKSLIDGVEVIDNLTVLVHLNAPSDTLLTSLAQPFFGIANPAVLSSAGDKYGTSADTVSGSGPYKVGEWSSSTLRLVPNPLYWGGAPANELEFTLK